MKNKLFLILLCIIIIFVIICSLKICSKPNSSINPQETTLKINNFKTTPEIAQTEQQRVQGLSGRKYLCETCSMLFLFPEKNNYSMWMIDMNFALDILWLDDTKIVHIEKNMRPCIKRETCIPKQSHVKANKVLEVPSGTVEKYDIKINQEVKTIK